MRDIAPGTVIDDRYEILERLGSGGMADVYCAQDRQLGRKVALKLLYRRFAEDAEFVERFRREASAAAGLQHPNVVGVYDRGEWDGTYYIAMEYLDGRSLKQLVQQEAPLAAEPAIDIVVQILKAARFAHRRGVIHRDLKPHNVIVDAHGRAKVTDFGIARAGASDMTETGSIMGTAQYLSPEQAQGRPVSATSDIYSIGIILYELLTGRVPFEGDSAVSIALKQVSEPPAPPSSLNPAVTPALEAVVMRALAKEPGERFADADAFIAALEQARAGHAAVPAGQATSAFTPVAAAAAGARTELTRIAPMAPARGSTPVAGVVAVPPDDVLPPHAPEPRQSRAWLWWLLAAVLLLGGGAAAAYLLTRPEQVVVPKVVGLRASDARQLLQNEGFAVNRQDELNATNPKGTVFSQDPGARIKADKGSTVTITVSSGPGTAAVPDVSGRSQGLAERMLKNAGFKSAVSTESSDSVKQGRVIRTVPGTGTSLDVGQTVGLVVSSGPAQVSVPDVVGKSEDNAKAALQSAGFVPDVTTKEAPDAQDGKVVSQTPGGGGTARKGSTVQLVVGKKADKVAVPDVVGLDQQAAANALVDAGLGGVIETTSVDTVDQDGIVQSQRPPAGRDVKRGTRITLTIGKFIAPSDGATP